jgi:hypothetical protein
MQKEDNREKNEERKKFGCNRIGANGKRFTVAVSNRQEVTQQAENRDRLCIIINGRLSMRRHLCG